MLQAIKKIASILFLCWGSFVFIAAMILVFPFILILSVLVRNRKKAQDSIFFFLKIWAWIFSILCFYPVRTKGINKAAEACIYVCNHNSYLDAIAVVIAISGSFKPLGKIEMVKIPVFGLIYQKIVVLIDRKSKESRARCVEELKADLANGQSILIFPEGTMNRTNEALADFYDGAFRMAIETQTDIVPMVILNARRLFPRSRPLDIKPGLITCVFGGSVPVKGLQADDIETLKAQTRKIMEEMINTG